MKLNQTFEVDAPLERVWDALIDVERVAPCLPGAAVTGKNDDGSFNGTFAVKIGPTSASYAGKLEMERVDEETHTAVMRANGTDKRGQGGARASITSIVKALDGGGTEVEVDTDYQITGRLARFGRGGMIEDISEKLLMEFAKNLQVSLIDGGDEAADPQTGNPEAPPPADPEPAPAAAQPAPAPPPGASEPPPPAAASELDAGALVAGVIKERIRSNPAPLVGGLLAILLLRRLRRRRRA